MVTNQPKKIYRYQRFNTTAIESLSYDRLHFADPAAFNDPLDCQPRVESDSDKNTLRQLLTELVRRRVGAEASVSLKNAKLNSEKVAAHAKKLGEHAARSKLANIAYNATNPEYEATDEKAECWLLTTEIERELQRQYDRGVCCFSASMSNPLLWSHYGDQHRGLCIGYGLDRRPKPRLHKVIYGGRRTVLTSLVAQALIEEDPMAQKLLDRNILLRKASPWSYEREWRLLGIRGVQESVLSLKDVTFGLRCSSAVMHAVITALDSREDTVQFYEMYEVRGSFKLKRRLVDIDELRVDLPHTAQSCDEMFDPIDEN